MESMSSINSVSSLEISECFISIRNTESPIEVERMERFANDGSILANSYRVLMYRFGFGVAKDKVRRLMLAKQVALWLTKVCKLESHETFPYSQYIFANFCSSGLAISTNATDSQKFLLKAVAQNYIPALHALAASQYYEGGVEAERNKLKLLQKCIDAQYTPALLLMGKMYLNGSQSVRQDTFEAVRFFRLAADAGCSAAKFELSTCYKRGFGGLTVSREEYLRLLMLSADGHYCMAQYTVGKEYETSDPPKAQLYYQKAADQSHKRSQLKLANIYMHSNDVKPGDYNRAYSLVLSAYQGSQEKSSMLGSSHSKACLMMGWCHLNGIGIEPNEDKAIAFYEEAIDDHSNNKTEAETGGCPRIASDQELKVLTVASIKCRAKIIGHMIKKNRCSPDQLQSAEAYRGCVQAVAELGLDFSKVYYRHIVQSRFSDFPVEVLLEHEIFMHEQLQFVFRQMLITGGEDAVLMPQFCAYLAHGLQHYSTTYVQYIYFPRQWWSKEETMRRKQLNMAAILLDLDAKIMQQLIGDVALTLEELQADAATVIASDEV